MAKRSSLLISLMTLGIVLPFYLSGTLMFIVLVSLVTIKRKQLLLYLEKSWFVLLFISLTIANSFWHRNEVGVLVGLALACFTLYFSCYQQVVTGQLYRKLLQFLSVGNLFACTKAIWDYLQYVVQNKVSFLYIVQEASPKFRAESTFFNANYFGLYCIFILIINVYLLTSTTSLRERWLPVISSLLAFVGLILTASRMVYPTVLVAIIGYFFMLNRKLGRVFAGIGVTFGAVIAMHPELIPRLSSLAYAFEDRFALWQTGWQIFARSPLLGRGPFSYAKYYYLFDTKPTMHSHQLLIDTLANYGLFGLLLLTCIAIPLIRRIVSDAQNGDYRYELALLVSMLIAVLVHGITDVSIFWLQTGYIFLIVILPPFAKMTGHKE
ncbi:O-antigen ligase family protein [Aerococcaceae bacterium NML180378]|nr:O-antigen ligase family protein [Aerococcaceae bacterium NML171108]MCW6676775.1 O-antigen ligase family protein [Aerococcaceae bacterium NML180378]